MITLPQLPSKLLCALKAIGLKVFDWFTSRLKKTKPVTKNSSIEEIDELNKLFAEYRKSVEDQAQQVEDALCEDIHSFAEDMMFVAQPEHPIFQKYHVRLQGFQRKMNKLDSRMNGVIMDKVSRVVSLDSPECSRVLRMLPGPEKDAAADELLHTAIQQGQETAAKRADELCRELLEEYEDAVSDAIDQISQSADVFAQEADRLMKNQDDETMELTLAKAESVQQAITLIKSLLVEEAE